jgi:hypothetical protein
MRHVEKRLIPRTPLDHVTRPSLSIVFSDRRKPMERLRDVPESGLSFYLDQTPGISDNICCGSAMNSALVPNFGPASCGQRPARTMMRMRQYR